MSSPLPSKMALLQLTPSIDDMDLFGYKMVFELDNKLSSYTNI
jgi:hypothetical protein